MTLRSELIGRASLCLAKASQEPERRQHWIDQTINCLEKAAMAEPDAARPQENRQRPPAG
jgi:hypothetical protein